MKTDFKNKWVLVTGASKGIGRAICLKFAQEGANIIAVARTTDLLTELKKEMLKLGASTVVIKTADLVCGDSESFARELCGQYNLDVVVHCIGGSLTSRNPFGSIEEFEEALRFNALHAIGMNSIIARQMIDNKKHGKIIHISSISAKMLRGNPLYASAKAYLNAYITSVGRCYAPLGVDLLSVMPGAVSFPGSYWDLKEKNKDKAVDEFLYQHQAIGRFGKPEEIANFVIFLSSDLASFICASNLEIDGGNM